MLEVEGLVRRFRSRPAVAGLSFTVPVGEVVAFLGANGAGKTTTLRMIVGELAPSEGRVRVDGIDVWADRRAAQHRIGYLPEGAPLPDDMSPVSFLRYVAGLRGYSGRRQHRKAEQAMWGTGIDTVAHQRIDTLSKGYRRRVALAAAILADPPLLVLDEPTDGLDPHQKRAVRALIATMRPHKAILISTHALDEVEAMCDRALVIDRGRIVADVEPAALARSAASGRIEDAFCARPATGRTEEGTR